MLISVHVLVLNSIRPPLRWVSVSRKKGWSSFEYCGCVGIGWARMETVTFGPGPRVDCERPGPAASTSRSRRGRRPITVRRMRRLLRHGGGIPEWWSGSVCFAVPDVNGRGSPSSASESVEPGAVVPEDLPLALLSERELEEVRGGLGVFRVVVRIVGREDNAIAGAALHGVPRRLLVAFDGDEPLADEVLARPLGDRRILEAPRILPVLVETPEPEGQPGPVAFEEGHLQSWEAGQHPAERHRLHGQHLLQAVRARVLECER